MNDFFPIKLQAKGPWWLIALHSIFGLALNVLLWALASFVFAYAAHKGWDAAR